MNKLKPRSIKVEHFAIVFLITGIIVLYFMSLASEPDYVNDYSELENFEGKQVIIKGIVIDHDTTSRGETILTVLEPADLESTLKIFIESSSGAANFTIGDLVKAKGSVLRISEEFLELVVINEKDIETIGHWHSYKLSIPELAHRLEHNPGEFVHLPVEISGYLKYEPRQPVTSLRLSEDPEEGFYTVMVDIPGPEIIPYELHKGDLISLNVSIEYNENDFEYELLAKNLTLLEPYGDWEVSLFELMEAPFVYEGAMINISGFIYDFEEYYNYIMIFDSPADQRSLANSSLWVDISGLNLTGNRLQDDYFITVKGVLYYDPQYIDYAIQAEKIFIN